MIDTHCHLEQSDFDKDRDQSIIRYKEKLKAIITSCAHPANFELALNLIKNYKGFIFAAFSIHPAYVKEINEVKIEEYFDKIVANKEFVVAIGETGLDYSWVKEAKWREQQKQLFKRQIELASNMKLPLVIHSRGSTKEAVSILESNFSGSVHLHMFTEHHLLEQVIRNGWLISVNTLVFGSKNVRKIVRDCPLDHLMLETDAPWLGIGADGAIKPKGVLRNEPLAVNLVAEKVAEIKKINVEDVDRITTKNAMEFFKLNLHS